MSSLGEPKSTRDSFSTGCGLTNTPHAHRLIAYLEFREDKSLRAGPLECQCPLLPNQQDCLLSFSEYWQQTQTLINFQRVLLQQTQTSIESLKKMGGTFTVCSKKVSIFSGLDMRLSGFLSPFFMLAVRAPLGSDRAPWSSLSFVTPTKNFELQKHAAVRRASPGPSQT